MNEREFITIARELVTTYANKQLQKKKKKLTVTPDDVVIITHTNTLQDNKILAGVKKLDGMQYEVSYNGNKGEIYLGVYQRVQNLSFRIHGDSEQKEVLH